MPGNPVASKAISGSPAFIRAFLCWKREAASNRTAVSLNQHGFVFNLVLRACTTLLVKHKETTPSESRSLQYDPYRGKHVLIP